MKTLAAICTALLLGCTGSLVDHDGVQLLTPPDGGGCPNESAAQCGTSCEVCTAPADATPLCVAHSCTYECAAPQLKCPTGCCSATHVAAGAGHTCAVAGNGVLCWGANDQGQLGALTGLAQSPLPVAVSGLTGVTAIAAGANHTCAISAGKVQCWGANGRGQLGPAATASAESTPVTVAGVTGALSLAGGDDFTCARTSADVRCWGGNDTGQLGDGTSTSRAAPAVVNITSPPTALAAGSAHACAISAQEVSCWGANNAGQIGNGASVPAPPVSSPVPVLQGQSLLGLGGSLSCAISGSGNVECWGNNVTLQIDGSGENASSPQPLSGGVTANQLVLGGGHSCALTRDGKLKCWGANAHGQLGIGSTSVAPQPGPTDVLLSGVVELAAGSEHTCAVLSGGGVACWGRNDRGQLGTGAAGADVPAPGLVTGR